jgi:predicted RNA-binding protein with TRAM domain
MSERVVVESLAPGGEGVIRLADGRVAFVSGVIEGERVRVELGARRRKESSRPACSRSSRRLQIE